MKPTNSKNFSAYAISLKANYAPGFSQALELGFKASAQQKKINFATIRVDEVREFIFFLNYVVVVVFYTNLIFAISEWSMWKCQRLE